jgi:uncharacterized protein
MGEIKLIFSIELIKEFLTVAQRPKFEKYFSNDNIDSLLQLFNKYGELIELTSNIDICREKR